jgi:O-methyltransferase
MNYRYNKLQILAKKFHRNFFPVPRSPYTMGEIEDICIVNLVPPEKLLNFFDECITLLEQYKGSQVGDYLEFGIFNGSSIGSMYLAAQKRQVHSMRFFGFDAFEGLPEGSENEDDGVWKKGFYACSFEKMGQCLARRNVDVNAVTWVKGWYDKTLTPELVETHKISNLGIVFIDCDTYSSSKTVLDFIASLIKAPVIICLDDWKLNDLDIKEMGEYKSFNEFLESNQHLYAKEIKSYNRKSRSFLITPLEK